MTTITLHRASRVLEAVERSRKSLTPAASVKFSVFSPTLRGDVEVARTRTFADLETVIRLLAVRTALRAAVARANASVGISDLLAAKAEMDDLIAVYEALPGVSLTQPKAEPEDDIYGRRRRKAAPPSPLVMETALAAAEAARTRYGLGQGDNAMTETEVSMVTVNEVARIRQTVAGVRRRLDRVVEDLRALNAKESIEIADVDMDWLQELGVI